jgi:hypothetical protein
MGEARDQAWRVQVHHERSHGPGSHGREDRRRPQWNGLRLGQRKRPGPGLHLARKVHPPFGSYGSGKGQFFFPADLAVDGSGNVYVTDDQSLTLAKFSPSGKVIWQIAGTASSDQDLAGHQHLASIDAHGRLVMVNDDLGRVLYVNPSGHKVDAFSPDSSAFTGGHVCEVTVDAVGDTYLSGCGPAPPSPTLVYDRAHRLIAKWPGTMYNLLRSPAFGPDGEVFALATDGSILRLRITLPAR